MTDLTTRRPATLHPARILRRVSSAAHDLAVLAALAAVFGAITGVGPTADYTTWPLIIAVLACYGAGHMLAGMSRSTADWLTQDEATPIHTAAAALADLEADLDNGADPELVLAALRGAHLPERLADIVGSLHGADIDRVVAIDQYLRHADQHLKCLTLNSQTGDV